MAEQRTVFFINNEGGGFAKPMEVEEGTTLEQFLAGKLQNSLDSYLIRVNNTAQPESYILQARDKVQATPTKIQGA